MPLDPTFHQDPIAQAVDIALLKQLAEQQQQELARLAEQHRQEMTELNATVRGLTEQVAGMATQMAEARGGWKAIALIGGVAATLGSALTWVVAHLRYAA